MMHRYCVFSNGWKFVKLCFKHSWNALYYPFKSYGLAENYILAQMFI